MDRLFLVGVITLAGWQGGAPAAVGQGLPAHPERPGPPAADWAMEHVTLRDGRHYEGLIESEDKLWVHLTEIHRPNGRPMYLVIRPIACSSVATLVHLDPEQRAKLRQRIEQFIHRARIEAGRMEAVELDATTREGQAFHHYCGKWFALESNASQSVTRQMIVRLEQVFTAYRQILPPRTEPQQPPRLVVLGSMGEYRAYLARLGSNIQSPACFIEQENLVIAGSDIARSAAALAEITAEHDRLKAELEDLEKRLPERLAEIARQLQAAGHSRSQIAQLLANQRGRFQEEIQQKRKALQVADRKNSKTFNDVLGQVFSRLYHEAFHAYLENYVYPHQQHDVPRWLNEGLAVIFESGVLDSDTLRIDAPNRKALEILKGELAGQQPLSLEQLLGAPPQAFLSGGANRYYVYSWGLAYYLAFENSALGSPTLDAYVQPASKKSAPVARFEKLVDIPLGRFEAAWREYILKLR